MISLIAALDSNFLIGKDNKLPWHYIEDLKFFKEKTTNQNVLVGYLTYKSLKMYYKNKPFHFKKVYVVSSDKLLKLSDAIVVNDLLFFLKNVKEEIIVIGGSQIYRQTLPYVDILYITHILNRFQGNIYFPFFNFKEYKIMFKRIFKELIFVEYHRINSIFIKNQKRLFRKKICLE